MQQTRLNEKQLPDHMQYSNDGSNIAKRSDFGKENVEPWNLML